jgi:hypothetical protein
LKLYPRYRDSQYLNKQRRELEIKNLSNNKDCYLCKYYNPSKGIGYCSIKKKYLAHYHVCHRFNDREVKQ